MIITYILKVKWNKFNISATNKSKNKQYNLQSRQKI